MAEVWAYVAHKDGMFVGVIAGSMTEGQPPDAKWRKEIAKFCGGMIADGFEITNVYSRKEYLAIIEPMTEWRKPTEARCSDTPDLFSEAS